MSMTNTKDENSDNGVPNSSAVIFPGQSHISRGITVLGGWYDATEDSKPKEYNALESMFRYPYRGLEVECLLRRQLVEQHVKDRCFPCSVEYA